MSETQEHEEIIAKSWFNGTHDDEQARLLSELQNVNFDNVKDIYAELYSDNSLYECF